MGCGGSLVDSAPFVRRVAGSNPTLATRRDLGQVVFLSPQLPVALRHETLAEYRAVSGVPLSSSELEEAL